MKNNDLDKEAFALLDQLSALFAGHTIVASVEALTRQLCIYIGYIAPSEQEADAFVDIIAADMKNLFKAKWPEIRAARSQPDHGFGHG